MIKQTGYPYIKSAMKTISNKLKTVLEFLFNPHLLICFGIAWFITNGWSYLLLAIGTLLQNEKLCAVAIGYLTILWIPFTPEKIVTAAIALWFLKLFFPNDEKTLKKLKEMKERCSNKRKEKKQSKRNNKKAPN